MSSLSKNIGVIVHCCMFNQLSYVFITFYGYVICIWMYINLSICVGTNQMSIVICKHSQLTVFAIESICNIFPIKHYILAENIQWQFETLSGIRLSFHGGSKVAWTEATTVTTPTKNPSTKTELQHYKKSENYFEFRTFVYGDGSSYVDFTPGEYSFPFSFPLPVTSPSSFSHEHGSVKYVLLGSFINDVIRVSTLFVNHVIHFC